MKRNILHILLLTLLALQGIYAQTSGSRLNMAVKKKSAVPAGNLRYIGVPANMNYKPLSLKNQTTLNNFYKTFLFSTNGPAETTFVLNADAEEKAIEKTKPGPEASIHSEEQFYSSDKITISNIYPNPANDQAELDYIISPSVHDARLIFYNVLGSQMQELPISKSEKKIRVNTREMPTGLYFYQLSVDGKKVATKKMLVRHQQ